MPHKNDLFKLWNELKRRKVVKTALVYVAVAWAILEASATIFPALGLPEWTITFVLVLLIIIFIIVIVLAWVYDITPEGIKVTPDLEKDQEEEVKGAKSLSSDQGIRMESGINEKELQQKIITLENQLKEAGGKQVQTGTRFAGAFKKLAFPVFAVAVLIIILFNKQRLTEILGFGNQKRQVAREHVYNAVAEIDKGDLAAANRELELALASDPNYSYAWSSLAAISVKEGDLNKAIIQTIKAVDLDPANGTAAYNMAYALEDTKDFNQAIEWYQKAIKADSTLVPAYSALGRLYNNLNQYINAILILNLAKVKYPESDRVYLIYKNLGNAYLLQNQVDSALKYLEQSIAIKPVEPEANLFLAKAYEAAGKLPKSIEQWDKYIGLETDTVKAREARKHLNEIIIRYRQEIMK